MINVIYFLLLGIASIEDYKYHKVHNCWTLMLILLGFLRLCGAENDRWVTLTLTCVCFFTLYVFYRILTYYSERHRHDWKLGGADVRLIPGMMLVQGWSVALTGVFAGFLLLIISRVPAKNKEKDIPLVPWMTVGCLLVEIL